MEVVVRELRPDDAAPLRAMHRTPEVSAWWGLPGDAFPFDDDPETTSRVIEADGRVAGLIQFSQEEEPDYRHATIDLFVDPARHRQGVARAALTSVIRHLTHDLGHHRITIDPAAENLAAVRCYEQAGFERVGVMRAHWRDREGRWRDGLLMELVRL